MQTERYRIEYFTDDQGNKPFREWLLSLQDQVATVRIRARLTRVRAGNFGSVRFVGDGVIELKIDHGPGYRVYYALDGETVLLLRAVATSEHSSGTSRRQRGSGINTRSEKNETDDRLRARPA